jgi:hypothetical protein
MENCGEAYLKFTSVEGMQYLDRSAIERVSCVHKVRYVLLSVFTFLLVYRSLRTVLGAGNRAVPMTQLCADSSTHLVWNYEKERDVRAQNAVLKRKYRIFPERFMVQDVDNCLEVSLRYFQDPRSLRSLGQPRLFSSCRSISLSSV